mgnify:CR=1 FL=1
MNLPSIESIIDLTVSASDAETSFTNNENTLCLIKTTIGGKGLEKYFENYKEYIAGDNKGKTSATCIIYKEIVWHLKNATSNYIRHLKRKHKTEFETWSKQAYKEKKKGKTMKQLFIEDSIVSPAGSEKYGSTHPRQFELSQMVFKNFIIELGLPLSTIENPAFIRAMLIVDPKFRVPSRRCITNEYLPKIYDRIVNKLKTICLAAEFVSLTFDGWTDRRLHVFYAITVHYVDQSGKLKAHLLAFNHITGKTVT